MSLREQVATGTGGIQRGGGGQPSSAMEKNVQPMAFSGWVAAEKNTATARINELLAAVTGSEPDETLREKVLSLVLMARPAIHQAHCPVQMLDGITHDSFKGLVAAMPRSALIFLLEEERKCRAAVRLGTGA
jgi:hypothetical protein